MSSSCGAVRYSAAPCTWGRRGSPAGQARDSSGVPQALERRCVAPPFGQHLHVQLEVDAAAEQRGDLGAGRLAERFDRAPPFPNHDALLAVALDVDHRPNIYQLRALPELVDLDRDRVGQLLMQQLERGLA